jgi:predicted PurR-regulated permease PerM
VSDWQPLARQPVPWRHIFSVIGAVIVTLVGLALVVRLSHVLGFLVVALFLAAVLTPPVDFLQRRAHIRRGFATGFVIFVGLALLAAMLYSFIRPLVDQAQTFADNLPSIVEDAKNGKGTIGELVKRYKLDEYVDEHQDELQNQVRNLGSPALSVVVGVFTTLFAAITILVLTVLILMAGPRLSNGLLEVVPARHRDRVQRVATDAARAASGYVFGNLVISIIAGVATWIVLAILGVPYAGVLGLWVGFTDLIPLVGATIGAVPTILFAFLHSVPAGIVTTIFFVAYQQFENHVLQVTIMSRTVNVHPLTVLVSVLVGVELFGLLGALLAIPGAGVVQVVVRDLWDNRRGRLAPEPSDEPRAEAGGHDAAADAAAP